MKITTEHLRFYQAKKTPVPAWIALIPRTKWSLVQPCAVSIHTLINCQVNMPRDMEAHNLMHIIRLVQEHKQETVRDMLRRLVQHPYSTDSKRRQGYARTWLKRLERSC